MTVPSTLADALAAHNFSVTDDQAEQLQHYCDLLWDWNTRLNLTRHTDYESFVTRDLHDSQQLASHLAPQESVLDVGSGGGVPGILLAVLCPSLDVTLTESTRKKAVALEAMVAELGLSVAVCAERAEQVLRSQAANTVTARAVAPLGRMLPWFLPLQKKVDRLLLIKGPSWTSERDEAADAGLLDRIDLSVLSEYATSGRDGHSVILELRWS